METLRDERMLKRRYSISEPSKAEATFAFFLDQINLSVAGGDWQRARELAKDWASQASHQLRIPHRKVWKEFKRQIAEHWFGRPEKRVFTPEWSKPDALSYATRFIGQNVRVSCFPEDIACHAQSVQLPANQESEWSSTLASLDRKVLIEIFPESSTSTSICFRRFSSAFGEEVVYEAGKGQAMTVFEEEQGKHPTVYASQVGRARFSWRQSPSQHPDTAEIAKKLKALIRNHDLSIQAKCSSICRSIGIDGMGLEGYFDPSKASRLIVVDLDLPFDFVFMA